MNYTKIKDIRTDNFYANNITTKNINIQQLLWDLSDNIMKNTFPGNIVVGGDRVKEFDKLSTEYNGKLYNFDNVEVMSAGARDPDSDDVTGMSASKQRKAAAEGDIKAFMKGVPKSLSQKDAEELFKKIRTAMNVKEGFNMWEIAPKFDWKGLRDNYVQEKIYRVVPFTIASDTSLIHDLNINFSSVTQIK